MKKLHKKLPFKKVHLPENPAILLPFVQEFPHIAWESALAVLVVESICRHSLIAGILFFFSTPTPFWSMR